MSKFYIGWKRGVKRAEPTRYPKYSEYPPPPPPPPPPPRGSNISESSIGISMGQCKKEVTPLLTHWSCVFPELTHRFIVRQSNVNGQAYHVCVFYLTYLYWASSPNSHTRNGYAPLVTCNCRYKDVWRGQQQPRITDVSYKHIVLPDQTIHNPCNLT